MNTKPVRIFLVGLPGAGKSHTARWLGRELGLEALDLDREIERSVGKTIPEIFRESGEEHFRVLESARLKELLQGTDSYILATGGGTPCFYGNMQAMNEVGLTVYLDIRLEIIVQRLSASGGKPSGGGRPLIDGNQDVRARITEFDRIRRPVYEKARLIIADDLDPEHLADRVRQSLRRLMAESRL